MNTLYIYTCFLFKQQWQYVIIKACGQEKKEGEGGHNEWFKSTGKYLHETMRHQSERTMTPVEGVYVLLWDYQWIVYCHCQYMVIRPCLLSVLCLASCVNSSKEDQRTPHVYFSFEPEFHQSWAKCILNPHFFGFKAALKTDLYFLFYYAKSHSDVPIFVIFTYKIL